MTLHPILSVPQEEINKLIEEEKKGNLHYIINFKFFEDIIPLIHQKHFIVHSKVIDKTGHYKITCSITDSIAATLATLYVIDTHIGQNDSSEHDAWRWQGFSISVLREFYPEHLKQTHSIIQHASRLSNDISQNRVHSYSEKIAVDDNIQNIRLQNINLINRENAETAFLTASHHTHTHPQIAEKIFKQLVAEDFFKAESFTELANMAVTQNKLDQGLGYFKQAETIFKQGSRRIGFSIFEWQNYAAVSYAAKDYLRAERIFSYLIETDFSEERKKYYKTYLDDIRVRVAYLHPAAYRRL